MIYKFYFKNSAADNCTAPLKTRIYLYSHTISTFSITTIAVRIIKGSNMKNPISALGILLLTILLIISTGSLTLLLDNGINKLIGLGVGAILLLTVMTFISYLFFDLHVHVKESLPAQH